MANPSNFRVINFTAMLYETLTGFFSINKKGEATWGYKVCAAVLATLQVPFTDFVAFRNKEYLMANCKFVIGQLTNVLNFLYDYNLKRIYIIQAISIPETLQEFAYPPVQYLTEFEEDPAEYWRTFDDPNAGTTVTIKVPAGVNMSDLIATVAQINITGIAYKIELI